MACNVSWLKNDQKSASQQTNKLGLKRAKLLFADAVLFSIVLAIIVAATTSKSKNKEEDNGINY